jgi:hypothetical protein
MVIAKRTAQKEKFPFRRGTAPATSQIFDVPLREKRACTAPQPKFDLVLQQHYGALLLHHSPVRRITRQLSAQREREGCAPSKLFSFFRRNARRLPNIRRRSWRAQKINIVSNEAKNSYLLSFSHTQREKERMCVCLSLSYFCCCFFSHTHTRSSAILLIFFLKAHI